MKTWTKGVLFVFVAALISGISIFFNKFAVSGINSDVFAFLKNLIVGILLFSVIILFYKFKELKKLTNKQWLRLSFIGLIGGAIPFILFFRGLKLISASTGSLIHKMMFLFVAVLAIFYLKERVNKAFFITAVLLVLGNALLLGYYFSGFGVGFGELLVLTATLFWAVETVISKKLLKHLDANIVAFGRMFFGSLFILAFLIFTDQFRFIFSMDASQISWVLFTSALLFGYVFFWYNGLKNVSATFATQILLIGAPVTTLFNYAFLGAAVPVSKFVGLGLILSVLALSVFLESKLNKRTFSAVNRS
ncbi:MAG: DMT family transporter [Nanoarchaeota archaeon]|nr:DMT family transporter [Nanoarchaeota archaeon]